LNELGLFPEDFLKGLDDLEDFDLSVKSLPSDFIAAQKLQKDNLPTSFSLQKLPLYKNGILISQDLDRQPIPLNENGHVILLKDEKGKLLPSSQQMTLQKIHSLVPNFLLDELFDNSKK
jgi:hypothetical protein